MVFRRLLCFWFAILTLTGPVHAANSVPRPVFQNGHLRAPDTFAFSHEGKTLASMEQTADTLILWDVQTGNLVDKYDFSQGSKSVPGPDGSREADTWIYHTIEFSADDKFVTIKAVVVIINENYRAVLRDLVIDLTTGTTRWSDITNPTAMTLDDVRSERNTKLKWAGRPAIVRNPNGKGCVAALQESPGDTHDPQLFADCDVRQNRGPKGSAASGKGYPLSRKFNS